MAYKVIVQGLFLGGTRIDVSANFIDPDIDDVVEGVSLPIPLNSLSNYTIEEIKGLAVEKILEYASNNSYTGMTEADLVWLCDIG